MWLFAHPALALIALLWVDHARPRASADGAPAARMVVSFNAALGIAGGLQLVRLLFSHSTWTIDAMALCGVSVVPALVLLAALAVIARRHGIRWRARGFLALAVFGAWSSSFTLLRDLNIDLDFGPAVSREMRIANLTSSTTLRGGTNYSLRLPDWTNEGKARDYDISKRQFSGFAIGQAVAFAEHRGALGFRWLGDLRAVATPTAPQAPALSVASVASKSAVPAPRK